MSTRLKIVAFAIAVFVIAAVPAKAQAEAASTDSALGWFLVEGDSTPRGLIGAEELFKLMNPMPFEAYLRNRRAQDQYYNGMLATRDLREALDRDFKRDYGIEINKELSKVFVLKMIANVMDADAKRRAQGGQDGFIAEVPADRLQYALRKILVKGNQRLNPGCKPEDPTPTTDEILRFQELYNTTAQPTEEWVLFSRLAAKVGFYPYRFAVRWRPGSDVELGKLAASFKEPWPEIVVSGQPWPVQINAPWQDPRNGLIELRDRFPSSLEALKSLVAGKLKLALNLMQRRKLVETWVKEQKSSFVEISEDDYQNAFQKLKPASRTRVVFDVAMTEIKAGVLNVIDDDGEALGCRLADKQIAACKDTFTKTFEEVVGNETKALDGKIAQLREKNGALKPEAKALRLAARREIPARAVEKALAAVRAIKGQGGEPSCADFTVSQERVALKFDTLTVPQTALERARLEAAWVFDAGGLGAALNLPMVNADDRNGNVTVTHYLESIGEKTTEELKSDNSYVREQIRARLTRVREIPSIAAGLEKTIDNGFTLVANSNEISFGQFDRLKLNADVTNYKVWIPQLFGFVNDDGTPVNRDGTRRDTFDIALSLQ